MFAWKGNNNNKDDDDLLLHASQTEMTSTALLLCILNGSFPLAVLGVLVAVVGEGAFRFDRTVSFR